MTVAMTEFELIREYFSQCKISRSDVLLGIGDDAAILQPPAGMALVVSMDTLVDGVHFDQQSSPYSIGWKAAAVNLSDMAAMGAEPAWATLSLTLPQADPDWLAEFSQGLFDMLSRFEVQLVGGDTSRGPLSVTLQLHGFVAEHKALRRDGARPGDKIFLTGSTGEAGMGLWCRQQQLVLPQPHGDILLKALDQPVPRVAAGIELRGIASSAIDISDGLLADLGQICRASQVSAVIDVVDLPRSTAFSACAEVLKEQGLIEEQKVLLFQLTSGDDYELCFTVPSDRLSSWVNQSEYYCIGVIGDGEGLRCRDKQGQFFLQEHSGFKHFS